jgi:hypothetical protein
MESYTIFPSCFAAREATAHCPGEASNKEVAVPKPFPILAAALVASGRSLSTVTVATPVDPPAFWSNGETEECSADSDTTGSFTFEAPFAIDPPPCALADAAALSA